VSKSIEDRGFELRRQGRRGGVVLRGVPEHRPVDSCPCLFCIRSRDADRRADASEWRVSEKKVKRFEDFDGLGVWVAIFVVFVVFLFASFLPAPRRVVRPVQVPVVEEVYRSNVDWTP